MEPITEGTFKAIVKIQRSDLYSGFTDKDDPEIGASMQLLGSSLQFPYFEKRLNLTYTTKTEVLVQIEFTENQQIPTSLVLKNQSYIGEIMLIDHRKSDSSWAEHVAISAIVDITLPIGTFHPLSLWHDRSIQLLAILNILEKPTNIKEGRSTVAYVKRVRFEVENELV